MKKTEIPKRRTVATVAAAVGCLFSVAVVQAQIGTAVLNGVVRDPSGASVPHADVTLQSALQKFSTQTFTDSDGTYVMSAIPPGSYQLVVAAAGFRQETLTDVSLSSGQASTLNISLAIAAAADTVTIAEAPPLLQTSNATIGSVIGTTAINELPLLGRNFTALLQTLPGISPTRSADADDNSFAGTGLNPSVFGQRQRNNNYTLDGGSNNALGGNDINMFPPPEAIAELKVESAMSSGAYGVGSGANVNVVTKAGTNAFHGDAWESFRNSALDARSFFVPQIGAFQWNQFGGALGGPVIVPHLVSKEKGWYFFVYYEGIRERKAANFTTLVATPDELSGNFQGSSPIYNPYTTTTDAKGNLTRSPFPNNQIPANLLNSSALAIAKAIYPTPNLPVGQIPGANYINSNANHQSQNQWSGRVDHQFGRKDNLFIRYADNYQDQKSWGLLLTPFDYFAPFKNLIVSDTHSFNPTLVLTGRFGVTRQNRGSVPSLVPGLAQTAGTLTSFPPYRDPSGGKIYSVIPGISITGYASLNESVSLPSPETELNWSADGSKVWGAHTIGFGGTYFRYLHNSLGLPSQGVDFGSLQTSNFTGDTGSALASFVLGIPADANRTIGSSDGILHGDGYSFYVQDDFRATHGLTVNLGLRYDYAAPRVNDLGSSGLIYETGLYYWNQKNPITGEPRNISPGVRPPDRNNFAPRVGIAYQISPRTVVRAGYGIFYNLLGFEYSQGQQGNRGNWPFASPETLTGINTSVPSVFFPNPFPGPPVPSKTPLGFNQNLNAFGPTSRTGYVQEWTLSVQRQLTNSLTLELLYFGSHGLKLDGQVLDNVAVVPGPGPIQQRQKYPNLPVFITNGMSIFHAYYEAGSVKIEQRLTRGLSFQANYTWSKNINDKDSAINGGQTVTNWAAGGPVWSTRFNQKQFKGPASFDIPHRLALSYIYQLPGKTESKIVNAVVGNWSLAGVVTADNGFPYSPRLSIDNENIGAYGGNELPNIVGNPKIANPTPQRWFNTDAFAVPAPYTTGNAGRNILRADKFSNWDFSLFKRGQLENKGPSSFAENFLIS